MLVTQAKIGGMIATNCRYGSKPQEQKETYSCYKIDQWNECRTVWYHEGLGCEPDGRSPRWKDNQNEEKTTVCYSALSLESRDFNF